MMQRFVSHDFMHVGRHDFQPSPRREVIGGPRDRLRMKIVRQLRGIGRSNKFRYLWYHSGTCTMKTREKDGVVDKYLNVYWTEILKGAGILLFLILDMSICPSNRWGNTYM